MCHSGLSFIAKSASIITILLIVTSTAFPVKQVKRQAEDRRQQARNSLVAGLLNFREIAVSINV